MIVDRRGFLGGATSLGLLLGFELAAGGRAMAKAAGPLFAPNAFLRISADNRVTVIVKHHEMGQGVATGLATLLAEELDADWAQVDWENAPANDALYKNLLMGAQLTGGSTAMANAFDQMRQAGATARAMIVSAAARKWGVGADTIAVRKGTVSSGRHRASFGQLAALAAQEQPPEQPKLKSPDGFTLIGRTLPRLDSRAKSTGAGIYTIDMQLPGLLTAVVARPPLFGGRVKSFDATAARAIAGVQQVVEIPEGVAVIAKGMWPAMQGRDALTIAWDDSAAERRSSDQIVADYRALLDTPGLVAKSDGVMPPQTPSGAVRMNYDFPYLAHAPMEPLNCIVQMKGGQVETWAGHQAPTYDQRAAAAVTGLTPDKVQVHSLMSGGSFGRRAAPDLIREAVHIAMAAGVDNPIRLQRTREDDMRAGYYRPLYVHRIEATLDDKGGIATWHHRIVGQSILGDGPAAKSRVKNGIDPTSVEGAADMPYRTAARLIDLHTVKGPVPVHWWRSVGHSHTAFAVETMMDMLAAKAGRDPVAFRLSLLDPQSRHAGVLRLAAEKAGWGTPLPAGMARGVAVHSCFGSYTAQIVEVRLDPEGFPKVERVVVAVDCGQLVNPDIVRAQAEGGVAFGLSATLYSNLTLDKGAVQEGNFDSYGVLRIDRMPTVDVHIVNSKEHPTGVGEIAVPTVGPAVANAFAVLTGKRIGTLPMQRALATA